MLATFCAGAGASCSEAFDFQNDSLCKATFARTSGPRQRASAKAWGVSRRKVDSNEVQARENGRQNAALPCTVARFGGLVDRFNIFLG